MHTLRRWSWVGCLAFVAAGPAAGGDPPEASNPPPTKKTLDRLLAVYRAYELPFPPANAALVRIELRDQQYGLGFRARDLRAGEFGALFAGTGPVEVDIKSVVVVDPEPDAVDGIRHYLGVELAVQCHARGWTTLAWKVLKDHLADPSMKPEVQLARSAWDYWLDEFARLATDRAKVARVLKAALKDQPDEFTVRERNLLDALELSLVPGKGRPGTVEALIDGLIEVTKTDRTAFGTEMMKDTHPAYLTLARRGFDAVPDLIAHLNDERLTRAVGDERYTVADIVRDLLQGLAGDEVSQDWERPRDGRVARADVEAWWADAQRTGEEAYFLEHIFGNPKADNLWNRLMLDVLAHKYPRRLPDVFRRMLKDRPDMLGWELGDAVANSTLPKETRRELFIEATRCKGPAIRIDGIWRLWDIDKPKGTECLLAELDRLPKAPEGGYWSCPETRLVYLVAHINEPAAWAALEKAAKRVDVGLRMELLNGLCWRDPPESVSKAYLHFRSRFLDDATVRDLMVSSKFFGPSAGSGFLKIEVRNYVALELAAYLGVAANPKPDWTAEQWAKLREDVKKALAREGIH
jgi:hypothetical protein